MGTVAKTHVFQWVLREPYYGAARFSLRCPNCRREFYESGFTATHNASFGLNEALAELASLKREVEASYGDQECEQNAA